MMTAINLSDSFKSGDIINVRVSSGAINKYIITAVSCNALTVKKSSLWRRIYWRIRNFYKKLLPNKTEEQK